MTRNIDELNNFNRRSMDPEKYFGEMELTDEQKKNRIDYTQKVNEILDMVLVLLLSMSDKSFVGYDYVRDLLQTRLLEIVGETTVLDSYLLGYIIDITNNFIDVTRQNIDNKWYTSSDRALYNAENSANDVYNYIEYIDALMSGKTKKQWIAKEDNRVRKTHQAVDRQILDINEPFKVGFVLMRFPKDTALVGDNDREIVNCRCSAKYF